MTLYTMMPPELIFPCEEDAYRKQRTIMYQGVPLLVELVDNQMLEVVRVISSDPQHFLDERYFPGTKISLFNNWC
jgi:hypothetical protein